MRLASVIEFKAYFPGFRICVVKNFFLLVYAIIESRSCSLYKCAEVLPGKAFFDSNYKRLLRFVRMEHADRFCLCVSQLIMATFPKEDTFYIVIDRTNWKLGTQPINVLFVGVLLWERTYIPLLWEPLESCGNSNQKQRMALFEQFCRLWPKPKGLVLLADREFIGRRWIKWLHHQGIGMVIRLREKDYLDEIAKSLAIKEGFVPKRIRRNVRKHGYFQRPITLAGCKLHYVAFPDAKHKHKSARFITHCADAPWVYEAYGKRWSIEVFFKHVKTDGFNMEDLGVTQIDRVRMIMAAVSFAYVLTVRQGRVEEAKKPISLKKNMRTGQQWLSVSIFRLGYRWFRRNMKSVIQMIGYLRRKIPKSPIMTHSRNLLSEQSVQ